MKSIFLNLTGGLFLISSVLATPYITPEQWRGQYPAPGIKAPVVTIDKADLKQRLEQLRDEGFAYLFEYIQICDFLDLWQYSDTSSINYGGMIEGESGDLLNIIQTDNTQEAIRVWSHYAGMTGDTGRYWENIEAGWVYTMNFPAYSEEGETDYYRVHNCGWGLVAQMEYETVYGDSSFQQYADSCAQYIMTHPLSFTQGDPFYQQLHPLVTGWAAGALYQYGVYRSQPAYINAALTYGQSVKAWIEANPLRLSQNEVWAMSGGTAMWGVLNSVFSADSSGSAAWLNQYLPYMDTYSGPGEWNNSWNIWYAHAYYGVYNITGDSLEFAHGVFLVDTLLHQDTDEDGGIPAGSADADTMDQSWVSCYTDYMGIENILNLLPQIDAGISVVVYPAANIPVSLDLAQETAVQVSNYGQGVIDSVQVFGSIAPDYFASGWGLLSASGSDTAALSPLWQPPDTGLFTLTVYTAYPGDNYRGNDTLRLEIEVRGSGRLGGLITDAASGTGLACSLNFYHQEVSDLIPFASAMTSPEGAYSISLMAGLYRIEVLPAIPYNSRNFISPAVIYNQNSEFDMELTPAIVLLADDDDGGWFENYYISALEEKYVDYYYWDMTASGSLNGETSLFPTCIWFTGNATNQTLTAEDKEELRQFLEGGGCLLLTGQNIGDELGPGDEFMNEYLRAEHSEDDVNQYFLNGSSSHPLSQNSVLFLIGSPGAGNQNSPASCIPLTGGEEVYYYQNAPNPIGAVGYESAEYGYKSLYFAFGLEAVSGLVNTMDLAGLLENIFAWWGYPLSAGDKAQLQPGAFVLKAPYPNPFNPSTRISYIIPAAAQTELAIYNTLGQKAVVLWRGWQAAGEYAFTWNAGLEPFAGSASGVYFCRLKWGEGDLVRKLILVK